jgi:hypothetical protein
LCDVSSQSQEVLKMSRRIPRSRGALSASREAASRPVRRADRSAPRPPREAKEEDDEKKLIDAFPNRHAPNRATNFRPALVFQVNPDDGPPPQVETFARKIFQRVHNFLSSQRRTIDRRVQYDSFTLGINYESKIEGGAIAQGKTWRYLDLGNFNRDDFQDTDDIIDRLWEDILEEGTHYGDEWIIYRFQYIMVDINWDLVGACNSKHLKIHDQASGMILQSYKSKQGNCGPVCALRALRDIKNQLDPTAYGYRKNLRGFREAMNRYRPPDSQLQVYEPCTPLDIHNALRELNVNLVVYDVSKLTENPIYGREGLPAIATIRLAWCSPDSPYSNGEAGHYLRIIDTHYTCHKCGENVDRNATVKHFCKWECDYCSQMLKCSAEVHMCEQRRLAISETIDNTFSNSITNDLDEAKEKTIEELLTATPEEDDVTKKTWKEASNDGHVTMLLGGAGTGKTYTVCEYVKEIIDENKIQQNEIAIVSAEGVGVTPYLLELGQTDIHIGTIHSLLSLRVGQDPLQNASLLLQN